MKRRTKKLMHKTKWIIGLTVAICGLSIAAALTAALFPGCGPAKMDQLHNGMTLDQAEKILGRPLRKSNPLPEKRQYKRAGDHRISVSFQKGVVVLFFKDTKGQPEIDEVREGMTVEQVEQILGKPLSVQPPTLTHDIRLYNGDGNTFISVTYKDGIVIEFREIKRHFKLPIS